MHFQGRLYTGRGQTVAILDSGVDIEDPRLRGAEIAGMGIRMAAGSHVQVSGDFRDTIGRGTELAAAVRAIAPDVRLLCVKIMDGDPRSSADLIAAGIELASKNAGILSVSVGTPNMGKALLLRDCCTHAVEAGAMIFAAGHPKGHRVYPADLPETVGVSSHPDCGPEGVYYFAPPQFHPKVWGTLTGKFLTYGYPAAAPASPAPYVGSSLATAYLAGRAACLREAQPEAGPDTILASLRALATAPLPELGFA